MIRVVYRWKVKLSEEDLFVKAWIRVTRAIRAQLKGARGSQLLRSRHNSQEFIALACWESFEDWQAFRQGERIDPEGIETMHAAGELLSLEVWDEVENLLKSSSQSLGSGTPALSLPVPDPDSNGVKLGSNSKAEGFSSVRSVLFITKGVLLKPYF